MEKLPNIEMKSDPLKVFFFFLKELFLGLQRQLFSSLKAAIVVPNVECSRPNISCFSSHLS